MARREESQSNTRQRIVTSRKGTREFARQAKARAVQLAVQDQGRTQGSVAAELGVAEETFRSWLKRDPEFKRQFQGVRGRNTADGPPSVPGFKEFRLAYLNTAEENPVTLRRQTVGITFPYMEKLVSWLSDDSVKRILALWPVRHAKTKLIEQFVVREICRNPNIRIAVICGSETLAKDRIYAIQQMLEDETAFPELHQRWGAWIGRPEGREKSWKATSFYVRGRSSAERDPTVRAFGVKSKILGIRADLIILDDVDDPNNGPEDRRKILRNINTAIRTRLNDGGRVVVIGNRCGEDDVYSHLLARKNWETEVLSAYRDSGEPLCEEMYSAAELELLAEDMTPAEFALMLLNQPSADEGVLFPRTLVEASFGAFGLGEKPENAEVILSLDPAPVGRAALVALAHEPSTGEVRVIDIDVRSAAGYEGLFQMLSAMVLRYKPREVVVEEQGGASPPFGSYPEVRSFLIAENAKYKAFHTGANKNDPKVGVGLVKDLLVRGRLRIAWGTDEAKRKMKSLVDDLIAFQPVFTSKRRYDTVMALWFGCNHIQQDRRAVRGSIADPLVANRPYLLKRRMMISPGFSAAASAKPSSLAESGRR